MEHQGRMCFEKVAETPPDDARLRHEGWILSLAAHPGVVSLAEGPLRSGGRTTLRTRAVPGRPLAAMDELSAREVAGLGAAVATTVADLHDAGITHGRLSAEHIVVDPDGRPVLCGFSGATAARCNPAPAVTADVVALGRTLATLLAVGGEPYGARPVPLAGDRGRAALARLLGGAGGGGRRGSARWLAERLGDGCFAPTLPWRTAAPLPG